MSRDTWFEPRPWPTLSTWQACVADLDKRVNTFSERVSRTLDYADYWVVTRSSDPLVPRQQEWIATTLTLSGSVDLNGSLTPRSDNTSSLGSTSSQFVSMYTRKISLYSHDADSPPAGVEGELAYFGNGDAGSPCLAVYDGADWLRISLGSAVSST